ncbi:uncharacterized protein LACBIDRAFT_301387 [Laccaria bicolor S238N-H82]|uniref:Predicted protein n=1 Tax=Laccaria bicolor (strain S238N-H82 / ATCC MYA-4686) TaxID=486041 RepID=B0CNF3_LACBS|nr:uncharacterized protein LACBIDRAFT_301387 [Laccaria bicolor S238N-H82]EDR15918.1 predicted protein [Laccaria bicolor S238N-H82]|eukprot:XP_001874126.1 predicted protein [Laccaria bicolor S238N-H82]
MQVLRFLKEYGNTLQNDREKLFERWSRFIFHGQLNPDRAPLENELLRLVRSVTLIHPSFPPPSGLLRLTWCLTQPGPYRYRNVPLPNNTATFDCLVIWVKEIDKATRYRVSIWDNATVEWIEGDDIESLKRLVH